MAGKVPRIPPESMRYATIGIEFIGVFLVFLAAGMWADGHWGPGWPFTLVGMVLGFLAGMYRLARFMREYTQRNEPPSPDER